MLYVQEIVSSLNGEINLFHQGSPALFVRFAGCNFKNNPCLYCDTKNALHTDSARKYPIEDLIEVVKYYPKHFVIVLTGGEPLFQDMVSFAKFTDLLISNGYEKVVLETNGSIEIERQSKQMNSPFPFHAKGYKFYASSIVMDYKLPSSLKYHKMEDRNFYHLNNKDFIKFPVLHNEDLEVAVRTMHTLRRQGKTSANMVLSPVFLDNQIGIELDKIIDIAKTEDFIVSVQLHKLLNFY